MAELTRLSHRSAWVTRGFQAMYGGDAPAEGRGMVFVRAYTRTRDGHTEHVGAHTRHAPQHQGDEAEPEGDQTGPTHLARGTPGPARPAHPD